MFYLAGIFYIAAPKVVRVGLKILYRNPDDPARPA